MNYFVVADANWVNVCKWSLLYQWTGYKYFTVLFSLFVYVSSLMNYLVVADASWVNVCKWSLLYQWTGYKYFTVLFSLFVYVSSHVSMSHYVVWQK